MTVKTITYFYILFQYAHELGQARLSGDEKRITKAEEKHKAYEQLCLNSDELLMDIPE